MIMSKFPYRSRCIIADTQIDPLEELKAKVGKITEGPEKRKTPTAKSKSSKSSKKSSKKTSGSTATSGKGKKGKKGPVTETFLSIPVVGIH